MCADGVPALIVMGGLDFNVNPLVRHAGLNDGIVSLEDAVLPGVDSELLVLPRATHRTIVRNSTALGAAMAFLERGSAHDFAAKAKIFESRIMDKRKQQSAAQAEGRPKDAQ
jgi:hypothetical protein